MKGPTRIWTTDVLPTTPPTSFSKTVDVVFLPDATAYQWINNKWTLVKPVWAGIKGDKGDKGDPAVPLTETVIVT